MPKRIQRFSWLENFGVFARFLVQHLKLRTQNFLELLSFTSSELPAIKISVTNPTIPPSLFAKIYARNPTISD